MCRLHFLSIGEHAGRLLVFRTDVEDVSAEARAKIQQAVVDQKSAISRQQHVQRLQACAEHVATHPVVKLLVGVAIFVTLVMAMLLASVEEHEHPDIYRTCATLDFILTLFFLAELLTNCVAYWFWTFWSNGWFLFDTAIVTFSVVDMLASSIHVPALKHIRVLRIFR